jgi:hypothetical protein
MGEQINFPGNYERYIEMGQTALANQEYSYALEQFKAAYQVKQEFSVNELIVKTALLCGANADALEYAAEMVNYYLTDGNRFKQYLTVLAKNQKFVRAYQLIVSEQEALTTSEVAAFKQLVNTFELTYEKQNKALIYQLLAKLHELEQLPANRQLVAIKESLNLPQTEFLTFCEDYLANKQLHVLGRCWLLEQLVLLGSQQVVQFLAVTDELYVILPIELANANQNQFVQQGLALINEQLANDNPTLAMAIEDEFKLQASLLYPTEIVNSYSIEAWFQSYLMEYELENIQETPEIRAVQELKRRIQLKIQDLF